jgi:Spy/CpxP family protein refolding chaperone
MAAAGKMDRLQNYVTNWTQGTKLTPTQRQDFQNLANELYAAAGQTYNMKRNEYVDFGSKYKLDATKALGAPAKIPSLMTNSGALDSGGGGQQRKPLGSIFNP